MQSLSDLKIEQLADKILQIADNIKEKDYVVGVLLTRLAFTISRAETSLQNVKDTVRSVRAGDGDSRTWEECAIDCEDYAQDGISNLLYDLFGE